MKYEYNVIHLLTLSRIYNYLYMNRIYIHIYVYIVYILIYILRKITFFCSAMTIYIPSVLFKSNRISFSIKSINHEFLSFLKSLNKHSIQYFEKVYSFFFEKVYYL